MSHSGIVFPYGITLRGEGMLDTFPAAELFFLSREKKRISLFLLIDSGAAVSALPATDAESFGIEVSKGKVAYVAGVDGQAVKGWRHEVEAELGKETISFPLVFLEHERAPRVLGREGIFDRFAIIFQENKNRTGFLSNGTKESLTVSRTLDKLN